MTSRRAGGNNRKGKGPPRRAFALSGIGLRC
jgi:hypothetical protein